MLQLIRDKCYFHLATFVCEDDLPASLRILRHGSACEHHSGRITRVLAFTFVTDLKLAVAWRENLNYFADCRLLTAVFPVFSHFVNTHTSKYLVMDYKLT